MNLRQRSSKYNAAVLFCAGVAATLLVVSVFRQGGAVHFEILLGAALVVSLILHARAGFALSRAQHEVEMLRGLMKTFGNEMPTPDAQAANRVSPAAITSKVGRDDAAVLETVKEAIEHDRCDLYLQPIISLPQRKQRYFEAFSRLRKANGKQIEPDFYIDAAERHNKIGLIDNLILLRAVQSLRQLGPESHQYKIFCNISPATIFDKNFFQQFTDYLDANEDLASRLVFEFTYPAVEMMNSTVSNNLIEIAERGYVFSVDHIRQFDLNWMALKEKSFSYVKASSQLLLANSGRDDASRSRMADFKSKLEDNGISLIVEKVERDSDVPEILSLGVDYGQGRLFGAPRPANFYIAPSDSNSSENAA